MLAKGHHGVELDGEAWDRLVTWIDFNSPYHGRWSTIVGDSAKPLEERRAALRACYAKVEENHEQLPAEPAPVMAPVMPPPEAPRPPALAVPGWPFGPQEARRLQAAAGKEPLRIDLGDGIHMDLVPIPAGAFAMGSVTGYPDEFPMSAVRIGSGFWMGKTEVTNRQFRRFDPAHDSREEDRHGYQFGIPGYTVNEPDMPAVRLSWSQAVAFCDWLSARTGKAVSLPTEAQWEWACRAGSGTPFWYGGLDTDFSPFANLGDASLADFSGDPYTLDRVKARYNNPENPHDNWIPQEARFNDGGFVSEPVGKYKPNPWDLHDMHGNVAEWTSSPYRPYPYAETGTLAGPVKRVVRGGSWYDRPKRCASSYRFGYREYQKVFNVGFRVVLTD
jgi:formylglycine-generating enzyme required for sulfatase activity